MNSKELFLWDNTEKIWLFKKEEQLNDLKDINQVRPDENNGDN